MKFTDTAQKYGLKIFVAGILFVLIFRSVDSTSTAAAMATASPAYLLAAVLFQISCNTVAATRWRLIMKQLGFQQSASFYLKSYFKGVFFNQGLPTSIGGDGIVPGKVAQQRMLFLACLLIGLLAWPACFS
jgi:uncharacterized protein (TIRG00374 family)